MDIEINIPVRAIGFNNYQKSARNGRRYTTPRGKKFDQDFSNYLLVFREKLRPLVETAYPDMILVDITYLYSNYFVKKESRLNSQCPDVDAPNKMVVDLLCGHLGFDDRLVKEVFSCKFYSPSDAIIIKIEKIKDPCFLKMPREIQSKHSASESAHADGHTHQRLA